MKSPLVEGAQRSHKKPQNPMYYRAQVELNPSEITLIERVKPSHVFGKMLHFLTAGLASPEEEQQTFTAITILQQLNRALRDAGVTNIVRLSKDQIDFYFDEEAKKNDLKAAVETFQYEVDHIEAEVFEDLKLVVEHETELLKLLIEIDVVFAKTSDFFQIVQIKCVIWRIDLNTQISVITSKFG